MAYYEYYTNHVNETMPGIKPNNKALCKTMCPDSEINMRERSKLVHILEVVGDKKKLVKCYSRSAADSNMALPDLLRPFTILKDTVSYLLLEVTKRTDVPLNIIYDFINDRLRAVRQDMIIQDLPPDECMILLEPMVRFHVYFGYKLAEYPIKEYEPKLNKTFLLECLKLFLRHYDAKEASLELCFFGRLKNLQLNEGLTCDTNLMESLYVICNLDDIHPIMRYYNKRRDKCSSYLLCAVEIYKALHMGNFVLACKLSRNLCPLTMRAFYTYLPVLQRQALLVMNVAYSSPNLTVPVSFVMDTLCFNSVTDVKETCRHYGIKIEGQSIRFNKSNFNVDAPLLQPKLCLTGLMQEPISKCFTYKSD